MCPSFYEKKHLRARALFGGAGKKDSAALLRWIRTDMPGDVAAERTIPAHDAQYAEWPNVCPAIVSAFAARGIEKLYIHQAEAIEDAVRGLDTVVVTPTASGKTLCYNVPVLDAILKDDEARAIYIFPTKALAQDQMAELYEVIERADLKVRTFTYDGDTPPDARTKIRDAGHIVITNPDMLHTGILPHHTKWRNLFKNIRYIVIDELHTYRGIFGSHFALILQRLMRICRFYGSDPKFICCSATIANPKEHAERLIGRPVVLIDSNGASSCERRVMIYDPPVVNTALGIRRSSLLECARIAIEAIANDIRTIVFTRSRINVELLLKYLQEWAVDRGIPQERISGYRGGYLPNERRAIEKGLRSGSISCVISTNALELGVDIGSLELVIMHGYPGSIASSWQQIGRAGRRVGDGRCSAAVLVASSLNMDQFLVQNPDIFFGASPEHTRIDPTNPYIQIGQIKCSAFELPFAADEQFGPCDTKEALDYLARNDVLHFEDGAYHWQEDSYPAASLSLRSATSENFVIHDITDPSRPEVIGQMDRRTAPTLIFPQAIYFHLGEPYQVEALDHEQMRCYVKKVDVDYYTDGDAAARIEVLEELERADAGISRGWGEVLLATRPTIYKKIKLFTHENVGYGNIHLPEEQMHTTAYWINIPELGHDDGTSAQETVSGIANLMRITAPLFLMCDRGDIIVHAHERDPHFKVPTIYLADNIPGGIGLAEELFDLGTEVLQASLDVVKRCGCKYGCPACIGATVKESDMKRVIADTMAAMLETKRSSS